MKLKENNKGMSLIMVITAVALVTLLVTVILTLVMYNFQMKTANTRSKNNFYNAEKVLDEIRLGLQSDVSDAMSQAYVETMTNYAATNEERAKRTEEFNDTYIEILRKRLESEKKKECYDKDYLLGFLDKEVRENTALKAVEGKTPALVVSDHGLTLKNLHLSYQDSKGYLSQVTTDIQIKYPQMDFTQSESYPNVLQYAIIAQGGIEVPSQTSKVTIAGSLYAGGSGNSLLIENGNDVGNDVGNNVLVEAKNDVIIADTLKVASGAYFEGGEKVSLWAKDLEAADGSKLTLKGSTYVKNDLTLEGGTYVTISGDYYGFGNPKTAAKAKNADAKIQSEIQESPADFSSAILINAIGGAGKAKLNLAKLNLEGVNNLVLAGNAYVGNSKVMMGESLTVKSNQIAYLVPESCMGSSNPMTPKMRNDLMKDAEVNTSDSAAVADWEIVYKNNLLREVKEKVSADVVSVDMMSNGNQYYYYMRFDNAKAASNYFSSYFSDTKGNKGNKLKDYLALYVDEKKLTINRNSISKKTLNGNILVYDKDGISSIGDTITEGSDLSDDEEYQKKEISWQEMFASYNTNLTISYDDLSSAQKHRTVYKNLVKDTNLFKDAGNSGWFLFTQEKEKGTETYGAYITNNTSDTLVVDEDFISRAPSGAKIRMIIAAGDVKLTTAFTGTIIAGGKVTIASSTATLNCSSNPLEVANLIAGGTFHSTDEEKAKLKLETYLTDAERYIGRVSEIGKGTDNRIRPENLVVYTNWSKE